LTTNFPAQALSLKMKWYVYIVEGRDKTLYTGITTNVRRRLLEHNSDNRLGAKSLRPKRPVILKYFEEYPSQTDAAKREKEIKNWKRRYKLRLIDYSGFTRKSRRLIPGA